MLIASSVMVAWMVAQAVPLPTVEELETRVLTARKRIVRGELVIDARDVGGRKAPPPTEHRLWFDGDKRRDDCRKQAREGWPLREIRCRNCPTANNSIRYDDEPAKTSGVNSVQMLPMKDPNNEWYDVLDARGLGLVPRSVAGLARDRMDNLLGRPDRTNLRVSSQTWKGQQCYRIDFDLPKRVTGEVWVVPAWGDSVVKVQIAGVPGGQTLVDTVETEVAPVGADGVWFPTVCTYTRLLGGELEYRQVAKIEVKSLNQPIDPRVFTLAGMDLPSPIPVITQKSTPEKPVAMWDGTKLVDATP
jgi:hypothetical protein